MCICIDRKINPLSSAIATLHHTHHTTQLRTFQILLLCWGISPWGWNPQQKVWMRPAGPRLFCIMVHPYPLLHLTALPPPEISLFSPLATCSLGSRYLLPDATPWSKFTCPFISHIRSCSATLTIWAFGLCSWAQKVWPAESCTVTETVSWLRKLAKPATGRMKNGNPYITFSSPQNSVPMAAPLSYRMCNNVHS